MPDVSLYRGLFQPDAVFDELSREETPLAARLCKVAFLPVLLPPLFAWFGAGLFGWHLGGAEPLYLDATARFSISLLYALALALGLGGTALIGVWISRTYGARADLARHFAFYTVVALPLGAASVAHLFPHVFFNVLVLIPTLIWSITLLYRGLPRVMGIPPERGMLMSSVLVGWLLVGAVSLLGLSMILWTQGIGPSLGV